MSRPASAIVAIGGFGIGVALLSVATTASIILVAPEPSPTRLTVREAAAALKSEATGFERRYGAPPGGRRAPLIEQVMATELGRSPDSVRAVWLDSASPGPSTSKIGIAPTASRTISPASPLVLVQRRGELQMVRPKAVASLLHAILLAQPQPAFIASVRETDGRWLSVQPKQPLLSGWRVKVLAALAVSLLLLGPLAWAFARRLTRPFRVLARALDDVDAPIPEEGPRELREAAAAILAMRARLAGEAAEHARMMTAVAHDLRTPLTGLRLRIEAVPAPQRERMVADVERMQRMIDEVLDFARDAAAPEERLSVRSIVEDIVLDMDSESTPVRLAPGPEAWIDAPPPAFRRAIENLVRNAIDYAGGCAIEVRALEHAAEVAVVDTGPGIPADDRERLLRPFQRGDASRNRNTGGAGLGLSNVQNFAIRYGGSFTLQNNVGEGLTATLQLPAAKSDYDAVPPGRKR